MVDHAKGAKGKGTDIHAAFDATAGMSARDLEKFIEALQYYLEIRKKRRYKELSEYTFTAEWLQQKPKTTVDRVLYLNDELHVFDWKTGTILVEVVDNEQLLFYAACAAQEFAPQAKGVWLHIVQPWADNMEAHYVTVDELAQFVADAQAAEEKILQGDTTFGPSDHCKFCPAYPHSRGEKGHPMCPATLAMLYPRAELDEDELLKDD